MVNTLIVNIIIFQLKTPLCRYVWLKNYKENLNFELLVAWLLKILLSYFSKKITSIFIKRQNIANYFTKLVKGLH